MADALSRRHAMLGVLSFRLLGLELIKEYYKEDRDFGPIKEQYSNGSIGSYVLQDRFLLKEIEYTSLNVPFESCWYERVMVEDLMVTLAIRKL